MGGEREGGVALLEALRGERRSLDLERLSRRAKNSSITFFNNSGDTCLCVFGGRGGVLEGDRLREVPGVAASEGPGRCAGAWEGDLLGVLPGRSLEEGGGLL